jgi:quercetin dioxygenase-like cupin family protein
MTPPITNTHQPLLIVDWADAIIQEEATKLSVSHRPGALPMMHAPGATGTPLVTNGAIGADLIQLTKGAGFVPHTHPGHHVLVVVGGEGTITYGGNVYPTRAGQTYLIEGEVPHGVGAITDHVILAVGAPHKLVDAEERMLPVPYVEVTADDGDLNCLICNVRACYPARLHDESCPHCPCADCVGGAAHGG